VSYSSSHGAISSPLTVLTSNMDADDFDCWSSNGRLETGSEITFERKEVATRFQRLPHIFDHARLRYATGDMADVGRHRKRKWRRHKPEVEITFERKKLATRFQSLPPHFRPCPTQISTADMARRRPTWKTKNGYDTNRK